MNPFSQALDNVARGPDRLQGPGEAFFQIEEDFIVIECHGLSRHSCSCFQFKVNEKLFTVKVDILIA